MKKTLSLLVLGLMFSFGESTLAVSIPYGEGQDKVLVTNEREAKTVFSSFFGSERAKYIHGSALYTSAMSEFAQEVFSKLGTTPEKWLALTKINRVRRAEVDAGWEHILKENLRSFLMTTPNIEQKGRFLDISHNFRKLRFLIMHRLAAEAQEVMVNTNSEKEFKTTPKNWPALTEIDRVKRVEVDAVWEHILKEYFKLFVDGKPTEAQIERFLSISTRFRDSDANIINELYEEGRDHLAKRRFRDLSLIKKIVNLAKGEGRVVRNVVNQKTNSQTKIDPKKTAARVGKK